MTDDNRDNITAEEALIEGRYAKVPVAIEHDIRAVAKMGTCEARCPAWVVPYALDPVLILVYVFSVAFSQLC